MKNFIQCSGIVLFALLLAPFNSFGQLDLGFNYQAVLRDAQGEPMLNQSVTLEFRIRLLCSTCTVLYTEVHNTSTNEHGLVSVVIGDGTTSDDLNDLNFHSTRHYLQVLVNGTSIGTQELQAVPSSLKATNMELGDLIDVSFSAPLNGQVLQWNASQSRWEPGALSGGSPWVTGSNGISYSNGNVGIGSNSNASHKVELVSGNNTYSMLATNNYTGSSNRFGIVSIMNGGGTGSRHALWGSASAPSSGSASVVGVYGSAQQGSTASPAYGVFGSVSGSGNGERWAGYFDGNAQVVNDLHIGSKVFVRPTGQSSGGQIELVDNDGTTTVTINANEGSTQGAEIRLRDEAGNVTIDLDADFGGNGRIITDELEIKGGSDLAEMFSTSATANLIEPGSVVVMDASDPGNIMVSSKASDPLVVGVVSGANGVRSGMLMGQEGTEAFGDVPVAIVGRVYVKADDSNGPIKPGDLLTSSSTPGHAMRVVQGDAATGTILGKALTPIGTNGFVLMLVNLR